jgi:GT2 family glycosyltransferase/glycosyltransferase involved in cell wall biosynthesis
MASVPAASLKGPRADADDRGSGSLDRLRRLPSSALNILVVNSDVAVPGYDSGLLRLYRIVERLIAHGHSVTFLAVGGYRQEDRLPELIAMGVNVFPIDTERFAQRGQRLPTTPLDFEQLLRDGRFDIAFISFFYNAELYLPLIRRLSPLTRIIVDSVDVHFVRERRGAELSGDAVALMRSEQTRRREQAIYTQADALVAVSEPDADAMRELAPDVPTFVVSNVHPASAPGPGFEVRRGLVFVGSFYHLPNVDGVIDFHRHAWPRIQSQLPDVPLFLVGREPPPEVLALDGGRVTVTGRVPQTTPYLDAARVSIAPLRFGAGVKGKIGEAMSHGVPVVTSTVGAEGIGLRHGEHALIADSPDAFAAAVVALHRDRALWESISASALAHIDHSLGLSATDESLSRLFAAVVRTAFVISAGSKSAQAALSTYVRAFASGDPTALVITVPEDDPAAAHAAFTAAASTLTGEGFDLEAVADVSIVPLPEAPILPGRAVDVDNAPALGTGCEGWQRACIRAAATPAPASARPVKAFRAAVLIHALGDLEGLAAQMRSVREALPGPDTEIVLVADDGGPPMQHALRRLSGVKLIRATHPLGRVEAWQLAARATRASFVVALSPLALPAPGSLEILLDTVRGGAAMAGPVVQGAAGLRAGPDGSIWPRHDAGDGDLDALALDCLALPRELLAATIPLWPRGEGMFETQMAQWARGHGSLVLATEATVTRLGGPEASVIVCTRDRASELPDCVGLLLACGASDVIIVDDNSSDATPAVAAEIALRSGGRVRVIKSPEGGLCHARNAGAAAARHNALLYIDDDSRPAPGWLEHLSRALARDRIVNAGGPISALWPPERVSNWPGRDLEAYLSILDLGDAENVVRAPRHFVYGANWAVRRDALAAVGGFDPAFGPGPDARINGDETSVALRIAEQGRGLSLYTPGAAVGHRIHPDRISDRFLLQRAMCSGVEQPRQRHALGQMGPDELLAEAEAAACHLHDAGSIQGDVSVAGALEQISMTRAPLSVQVRSASALGKLAASAALLGEGEVVLPNLRLRITPASLLRGLAA